jgi:hypothetical protein
MTARVLPPCVLAVVLFGSACAPFSPADYVRLGQPGHACDMLNGASWLPEAEREVSSEAREAARLAFLPKDVSIHVDPPTPEDTTELAHARTVYGTKELFLVPVRVTPQDGRVRIVLTVRLGPVRESHRWISPASGDQLFHLAGMRAPGEPDVLEDSVGKVLAGVMNTGARVLTLGIARPNVSAGSGTYRNPLPEGSPERKEAVSRVSRWANGKRTESGELRRPLLFVEGNESEPWVASQSRNIVVFNGTRGSSPTDALVVQIHQETGGCSVLHIQEIPLPPGPDLAARVTGAIQQATLVPPAPAAEGS